MANYRIEHYISPQGVDVFAVWFGRLRDVRAQARIAVRIDRLALGLVGDAKAVRDGVRELRIDEGPGYRVYFALSGRAVVLLLGGGDKASQQSDIARAVACWNEYRRRT